MIGGRVGDKDGVEAGLTPAPGGNGTRVERTMGVGLTGQRVYDLDNQLKIFALDSHHPAGRRGTGLRWKTMGVGLTLQGRMISTSLKCHGFRYSTPALSQMPGENAQRYIAHFPAAGEIILFDRSWYNRAGVERVMGFGTEEEAERFLLLTPAIEREIVVQNGIILRKYFLDISQDEQRRRFEGKN